MARLAEAGQVFPHQQSAKGSLLGAVVLASPDFSGFLRADFDKDLQCAHYHWGPNYYIPFFMFWGIIFGNYYRKFYSM